MPEWTRRCAARLAARSHWSSFSSSVRMAAHLPFDGISAGEIVARAPWLTQCYFRNPSASAELWSGGYLHTGDIGTIDERGWLQITDRAKDVIKTGGEWVSSLEDRGHTLAAPGRERGRCHRHSRPAMGRTSICLVVPKLGISEIATPQQLKEHVAHYAEKGLISKYAVPDTIELIDAIPRTSVGKVDKKVLRQTYTQA